MRTYSSPRRRMLVIGSIVSLTMFGGTAFASIPTLGNQNPQTPHKSVAHGKQNFRHGVTSHGLTVTQAVAKVLVDFAETPVRKIIVRTPKAKDSPVDTPWLTVEVAGDPHSAEATWLDVLVPEAVANLMSHGKPTTQGVGGNSQQFNSPSDGVLRSYVRDAASKFGLTVRKLTIVHPLESAISVSFTVPDNATVSWTIDQLRAAVEGSPRSVEASLIELYSTSGELLLSTLCAYRTGLGGLSFAPGQDERFKAMHDLPAQPMR